MPYKWEVWVSYQIGVWYQNRFISGSSDCHVMLTWWSRELALAYWAIHHAFCLPNCICTLTFNLGQHNCRGQSRPVKGRPPLQFGKASICSVQNPIQDCLKLLWAVRRQRTLSWPFTDHLLGRAGHQISVWTSLLKLYTKIPYGQSKNVIPVDMKTNRPYIWWKVVKYCVSLASGGWCVYKHIWHIQKNILKQLSFTCYMLQLHTFR